MYLFRPFADAGLTARSPAEIASGAAPHCAQLLASGTGMRWALEAQELLANDFGVEADVWSVTSWNELRREALSCEEHNLLNPDSVERRPYATRLLEGAAGPVIAVSDWMRAVPDQISRWIPQDYSSLGTDGYGRSDTRAALRRHFHVDAQSITVATLEALARHGSVKTAVVEDAIRRYGLRD